VIVNERVVPELASFLESNPDVGSVVCKTLYPDGSLQWMVKRFPTPLHSFFGRETFLTRLFPNNKISREYLMLDKLQQAEPFEIDSASSACMMVRREVLNTTGLFDEGYPFYWADIDYCRRIRDCGWNICFVPGVSVIHDMRNNAGKKKSPFAIKAFHRGVYRYFWKHCTKSRYHPLNLFALVGLSARAGLQLLLNSFKLTKGDG
jgi:GT2 family glycosyltransferase